MAGPLAVWSNFSSSPYLHNSHYTHRRTTCALRRKIGPECQHCQEFFLPLHCFAFFLPTGTSQFLHLVIGCQSNVTFPNSLFWSAMVLWRFQEDFSAMCMLLWKSCATTQNFSCNRRERSQKHSKSNIIIWSFLFWYDTPFWCPPDTKCEQQSFAPFSPLFKNVTHKNLSYK